MEWYRQHHGVVRVLAVIVPLLAAAGLHAAAVLIPSNAATLILVLLVVGAASTGDRLSGVLAAVSSAVGFDLFLTQPYFQLRIDDIDDLELAVLLLVVGLAVSELASWGIRQGTAAIEQSGFVRGALESADLAAGSTNVAEALERVADSLRTLLGAGEVAFEYGDHDASAAIVERDGTVRYQGKPLDLTRAGLPAAPHGYTAIPVVQRGAQVGYFRITTPERDLRPGRDQLRVAVLLAGQFSLRAEPIRGSVRRAARAGTPLG